MQNTMEWYVVKIIFQIKSETAGRRAQFDEQIRLIQADSPAWALKKANTMGNLENSAFLNSNKQKVQWKFIAVTDVVESNYWEDGAELYTSIQEPEIELSYLDIVNSRAKALSGMVAERKFREAISV